MKKETINSIAALVGTWFTYVLGAWDTALEVLVLFMVLDYLTGVFAAIANKSLSSAIGFKGLLKKFTILIVLIVAVSLDRLLNSGSWVFRSLAAYFYIANEAISLLENAGRIGLPIPAKLLDVLAQLKNKSESNNEKGDGNNNA